MEDLQEPEDDGIGSVLMKLLEANPDPPRFCLHQTVLGSAHSCLYQDSPPKNIAAPCTPIQLRKISSPQNLELDSDTSMGGWSVSMATPHNPLLTKGKPLPVSSLLSTTYESTTTENDQSVCSEDSACKEVCKKEAKRLLGGHKPVIRTLFPRPSIPSTESSDTLPILQPASVSHNTHRVSVSPDSEVFQTPPKQRTDTEDRIPCSQELFGSPEIFSPNLPVNASQSIKDTFDWERQMKLPEGPLSDTPGPPQSYPLVHSTPLYPVPVTNSPVIPSTPCATEPQQTTPLWLEQTKSSPTFEKEDVFDMLFMSKSQLESHLCINRDASQHQTADGLKPSKNQVSKHPTQESSNGQNANDVEADKAVSSPCRQNKHVVAPEIKEPAPKRKKLTTKTTFLYPSNQQITKRPRKRMRIRETKDRPYSNESKVCVSVHSPPSKKPYVDVPESSTVSESCTVPSPIKTCPEVSDYPSNEKSVKDLCIEGGGDGLNKQMNSPEVTINDSVTCVTEKLDSDVSRIMESQGVELTDSLGTSFEDSSPTCTSETVKKDGSAQNDTAPSESRPLENVTTSADESNPALSKPAPVLSLSRPLQTRTPGLRRSFGGSLHKKVGLPVDHAEPTKETCIKHDDGSWKEAPKNDPEVILYPSKEDNHAELTEETPNESIKTTDSIKGEGVPFIGFKMASGGTVSLSESSLSKAKQLINELRQASTACNVPGTPLTSTPKVAQTNNSAFTTPSLSKPPITSSASNLMPSSVRQPKPKPFKAPRSADSVSKAEENASLARILKKFGVKPHSTPNSKAGQPISDARIETGFSTASGSKLSASHSSMMKARRLLDSDKENGVGSDILPPVRSGVKAKSSCITASGTGQSGDVCSTGVKTASSKGLSVSKDSAVKALQLTSVPEINDMNQPSGANSLTVGFQTASGKGIAVSSDAMARAKSIFDTDLSDDKNKLDKVSPHVMTGFKTASGKGLGVSHHAMEKARRQTLEEQVDEWGDGKPSKDYPLATGFQTASGKGINVSSKALAQAKSIVETITSDGETLPPQPIDQHRNTEALSCTLKSKVLTGFSTAGGKTISVCSDSMKKAAEIVATEGESVSDSPAHVEEEDYISCLSARQVESLHCFTQIERKLLTTSPSKVKIEGTGDTVVCEGANQDALDESSNCYLNTLVVKQFVDFSVDEDTCTSENTGTCSTEGKISGESNSSLYPETPDASDRYLHLQPSQCQNDEVGDTKVDPPSPIANVSIGVRLSDLEATFTSDNPSKLDTSFVSTVEMFTKSMIENMDTSMLNAVETLQTEQKEDSQREQKSDCTAFSGLAHTKQESVDESPAASRIEDLDTTSVLDEPQLHCETKEYTSGSRTPSVSCSKGSPVRTSIKSSLGSNCEGMDTTPPLDKASAEDITMTLDNQNELPIIPKASSETLDPTVSQKLDAVIVNVESSSVPDTPPNSSVSTFAGFTTAGGRKVEVSHQALTAVRLKFSKLDKEDPEEASVQVHVEDNGDKISDNTELNVPQQVSSTCTFHCFPGLQTASGKKVTVSEESLLAAKATLDSTTLQSFPGLQTASDKEVTVSEQSIHVAKATLDSTPCTFPGLKTASGKVVSISEQSIRAAKATLDSSSSHSFPGLQTASGKKVTVSEQSLLVAKTTLNSTPGTFPGLKTASGKEVTVSEQSIRAAKATLESSSHSFPGLQTASGKEVTVSEQSLLAVKAALDSTTPQSCPGLHTASGTEVTVSEQSLLAAKAALGSTKSPGQQDQVTLPAFRTTSHSVSAPKSQQNLGMASDMKRMLLEGPNVSCFQPPLKDVRTSGESSAHTDSTPTSQYRPVFKSSGRKAEVARTSSESAAFCQPQRRLGSSVKGIISTPEGTLRDRRPSRSHRPLVPVQSFLNDDGSYSITPRQNQRIYFTPHRSRSQTSASKPSQVTASTGLSHYGNNAATNSTTSKKVKSVQPVWKGSIGAQQSCNAKNWHTKSTYSLSKEQDPAPPSEEPACTSVPELPQSSADPNSQSAFNSLQITLSQVCAMEESQQTFLVEERKGPAERERGKREDSGYVSREVSSARSPTPEEDKTVSVPSAVECVRGEYDALTAEVAQVLLNDSLDLEDTVFESPVKNQAEQTATASELPSMPTPVQVRSASKTCKVIAGTLLSLRSAYERINFRLFIQNRAPGRCSLQQLLSLGVRNNTLSVSFSNTHGFNFQGSHFFSGSVLRGAIVCVGDGVQLALRGGMAGVKEFWEGFRRSLGVDEKLISLDWFTCHYRQLVWKLAALEVAYPHFLARKCLTPDWLMLQMKYRYDREIDRAERSAIRKICEHDDIPSRRMVLCVSSINHERLNQTVADTGHENKSTDSANTTEVDVSAKHSCIELTDGWYTLPCVIDNPLRHMIQNHKLTVGTKLMISGAELLGLSSPCHPLEVPASCSLKISANSTRRARWYAKLGYQSTPYPFPIPLYSVFADGGIVGAIDVVISRVYPLTYLEKREGAKGVFRSERQERKMAASFERGRQQKTEEICCRVQKEFEDEVAKTEAAGGNRRRSRRLNTLQIKQLQDGEEIHSALSNAPDPVAFQELLSSTQRALLESYHQSLVEKRQGQLQERIRQAIQEAEENQPQKRNVTPLLKVRVVPCGGTEGVDCVLSVWRPDESLRTLLKEETAFRVTNLNTLTTRSSNFHRLQLTATRSTTYRPLTSLSPQAVNTWYTPRECPSISYLNKQGSKCQLPHGELDTVGVVACITSGHVMSHDLEGDVGRQLDSVFLADSEEKLLLIKVWDGLEARSLRDIIQPGVLLAITNLTYRGLDHTHSIPTATVSDITLFSQHPTEQYLSTAMEQLRAGLPEDMTEYLEALHIPLDF